ARASGAAVAGPSAVPVAIAITGAVASAVARAIAVAVAAGTRAGAGAGRGARRSVRRLALRVTICLGGELLPGRLEPIDRRGNGLVRGLLRLQRIEVAGDVVDGLGGGAGIAALQGRRR